MSVISKDIKIASGDYRARLEYHDVDNATSSYDSRFTLTVWHVDKVDSVQIIEFQQADTLYLAWLFDEIAAEMSVLKGAKEK